MAAVKMQKANRIITIDDSQMKTYLQAGYDQINEQTGEIITPATGGKVIPLGEHHAALEKIKELEAKLVEKGHEALEKAIAELEKERDELLAKAKDFAAKGKQLQEENEKLKAQIKK